MSGALLVLTRPFRYFCEAFSALVPPSNGLRELNTSKQEKLSLVGPPEPAGGGSLPRVAMALAGVGLAWPRQLDLREGGGPEHPTWIALVGWLDAGGASHH